MAVWAFTLIRYRAMGLLEVKVVHKVFCLSNATNSTRVATPRRRARRQGGVYSHHIYIVYWYTKHPGPIVYSHTHHVYIVHWYTKHYQGP